MSCCDFVSAGTNNQGQLEKGNATPVYVTPEIDTKGRRLGIQEMTSGTPTWFAR